MHKFNYVMNWEPSKKPEIKGSEGALDSRSNISLATFFGINKESYQDFLLMYCPTFRTNNPLVTAEGNCRRLSGPHISNASKDTQPFGKRFA